MKKLSLLVNRNHYFFSLLTSIFLTIVILVLSNSFNSGFHFVDDHEIVKFNSNFSQGKSFYNYTLGIIKQDLNYRLRPFYFIHRLLTVYVFGDNFVYLSLYTIFLFNLTFFAFYLSLKKLGLSFFSSICFACIVLIGYQAEIWWRLGPAETIGLCLFSLSVLFSIYEYTLKRNKWIMKVFSLIFLIFSSLSKESFLVMLPAFIFLRIWLNHYYCGNKWKTAFKQTVISNLFIFIFLVFSLIVIIFFIGTNQIGYAGISAQIKFLQYFKTFILFVIINKYFLFVLISFFGVWTYLFIKAEKCNYKNIIYNNFVPISILFLLIVVSQTFIYSKSTLVVRYYVPGILGISSILILSYEYFQRKKEILIQAVFIFLKAVFIFYVVVMSIISFKNARNFAEEGFALKESIHFLIKNFNNSQKLLFIVEPNYNYEETYSLLIYFKEKLKITNIYLYPILIKNQYDSFENQLMDTFKKMYPSIILKKVTDLKEFHSAFIFNIVYDKFKSNFNELFIGKKYILKNFKNYYVYRNQN